MDNKKSDNKRKSRRRLKWLLGIVGVLVIGIVSLSVYYYQVLNPKRHFEEGNLPIVSNPNVTDNQAQNQVPAGGFNVLLLGSDTRKPNELSRTDSIMLVHLNLETENYAILSIPRDTRVNL